MWIRANACRSSVDISTRYMQSRLTARSLLLVAWTPRCACGTHLLGAPTESLPLHIGLQSEACLYRHCTAMLQGHTALVCSLQLTPHTLVTGGADGRVLAFALPDLRVHTRIAAHDSSVTSLQFDEQFLVTGGNDGRVRLFDVGSGAYVRDITAPSDTVWKVVFRREVCAIMCRRAGKTTVEIWSFRPREERGERLRIAGR
jgi:WD40 repeat protein